MSRNENYPDDIRCYDNDPRSPFYVDPMEPILDARDELAQAWRAEYDRTGLVDWFGCDPNDELEEGESLGSLFDRFALSEVEANPEQYINGWKE